MYFQSHRESFLARNMLYNVSADRIAQTSINGTLQDETRLRKKETVSFPLLVKSKNVTTPRSIVYIHVGKTGGTTLEYVLRSSCEWYRDVRVKNKCFKERFSIQSKNESRLSHLVLNTVHIRGNNPAIRDASTFLITVRNPIARLVSSFDHDHVNNTRVIGGVLDRRNSFYKRCFPTAQVLADVLESNNQTDYCYQLGKKTVQGHGNTVINTHLFFNYENYAKMTTQKYPERELLVVRTEALWEDVTQLEVALGGSDQQFANLRSRVSSSFGSEKYPVFSHGSEKFSVRSQLSPRANQVICCFLFREIQVFVKLVQRATNLAESEKEKYTGLLYDDCGVPSKKTTTGNGYPIDFAWKKWATNGNICKSLNVV